jgi:predicted O-methyltransferase YrrM
MRPREVRDLPPYGTKENTVLPNNDFFYRPWMSDTQAIVILDLLYRLKPMRCLEFGSGYSTCFFPKFIGDALWVSIEHLDYFKWAIEKDMPQNVKLIVEPLGDRYVTIAKELAQKHGLFNFVFVDGDAPFRDRFVAISSEIMSKGAVLMRHDAGAEDVPVIVDGVDVRKNFSSHGIVHGFWWAVK